MARVSCRAPHAADRNGIDDGQNWLDNSILAKGVSNDRIDLTVRERRLFELAAPDDRHEPRDQVTDRVHTHSLPGTSAEEVRLPVKLL